MNATYCLEDDKLRLYAERRLTAEEFAAAKAVGFKWAPKQELFVATWTPAREDALLALVDEIEDEDYSPEERAADRAERFEDYRDKRAAEAGVSADAFEAGPAAFGHQSAARAERLAARHDRRRTYATSQWAKAEYWQRRTRAVIAHALHKTDAKTRRGRLLTLEAEARRFAGRDSEHARRWADHLAGRLAYETAMIEAEGGLVTEAEMVAGGFIGRSQIHGVNRSPVTGRVVSVKVLAPSGWHGDGPLKLQSVNVERIAADAYRAPTAEEAAEFAAATAARKAQEKAAKPKAPPLVNPTMDDAKRLQDALNARRNPSAPPSQIVLMTQAAYGQRSRGDYGPCETTEIDEQLEVIPAYQSGRKPGRVCVFKVRTMSGQGWDAARRVVVLTDKPQKALPFAECEAVKAGRPTAEQLFPQWGRVCDLLSVSEPGDADAELLGQAAYAGLIRFVHVGRRDLTKLGEEFCDRARKERAAAEQQARDNEAAAQAEAVFASGRLF